MNGILSQNRSALAVVLGVSILGSGCAVVPPGKAAPTRKVGRLVSTPEQLAIARGSAPPMKEFSAEDWVLIREAAAKLVIYDAKMRKKSPR